MCRSPRAAGTLVFLMVTLAGTLPACRRGVPAETEVRVAVATNFSAVLPEIAGRFERETGIRIVPAYGSTGMHYAQILNGAPFDLFLAADVERPRLLEEQGHAVDGMRETYAIGRLVLWSPDPRLIDAEGHILRSMEYSRLAIANPSLAPYGYAARQVLESLELWNTVSERLVRGENVGQTFQFVATGNAPLGFVSYSQVLSQERRMRGSSWMVPEDLYQPIRQQMVLLRNRPAARAFFGFMTGETARDIIRSKGYVAP